MRLVYTATQQPVAVGDAVTIDHQPCHVDFFRQPHKPDSEGKVTVRDALTPKGSGNREVFVSVIGAQWIEREDRAGWNGEPALDYNVPGHVCPDTGRIAMTVADAYARDDSPDRTFFTYSRSAATAGLEPWRLIDGLDASVTTGEDGRPLRYMLDFDTGSSREIEASAPVYMQHTKGERDAGAGPWRAESAGIPADRSHFVTRRVTGGDLEFLMDDDGNFKTFHSAVAAETAAAIENARPKAT